VGAERLVAERPPRRPYLPGVGETRRAMEPMRR
jgi:hypothetical protein